MCILINDIVQIVLNEQAFTYNLHNQLCMVELLPHITIFERI